MSDVEEEKIRQAYVCFSARNLAGTERYCNEILSRAPQHVDALHLLGLARLMSGNAAAAVSLIGKASQHRPQDAAILENLGLARLSQGDAAAAEAALNRAIAAGGDGGLLFMRLGMALDMQGKVSEAERAARTAAQRAPDDLDVHVNLGNILARQGKAEEALASYHRVLASQPEHGMALYNMGTLLRNLGRGEEALAAFRHLLALAPEDPDVHNGLGTVQVELNQHDEAERSFRNALAVAPDYVHAHSNLGNTLRAQGRLDEAAASCEKALAIQPGFIDALLNLGNVRLEQGRISDAQALYEKVLRAEPRNADAHRNLGWLFTMQGRMKEAVAKYRNALQAAPGRAAVHSELAGALRDSGEHAAAVSEFKKALELDPRSADSHYNLAETLKGMGRFNEAIAEYEQALASKPDYYRALGGLAYLRQHVCDWNGLAALWDRLRAEAIGKPDSGLSPFGMLYMPFSPPEQLACSREWARQNLDRLAAARARLGFDDARPERHPRLRIGYLSWDFHQHATAYLIAELFELHDRERFEVFTYSFGPDDGSPIRGRIRNASEHFTDVVGESFVETAQRIRRDGIDVLVDLKGYTMGSRPQILALRPAPAQVNWLGFPGSLGTSCVDFVIADSFIIPDGAESHYDEKVVRLPDCYQVNDRKREIAASTPTRGEAGLPADGLVFCSFNQTAKILPDVFTSWMRILKAVPGSTLWLLESNPWAVDNLRREAEARGVAAARLVFAQPRPLPEHLARYRLADLSLDTFPYGSHTTASDALWAGCPLVTRSGDTFASRVAGSLLINAGLRELVTGSAQDYERRVLELATSPARLQDVRRRLREGRDACPLFDTPRFVRNLESAFQALFDGRAAGKASGE